MNWLLVSDRAAAEPLGGMTVVVKETGKRLSDAGDDVHWITGRLNESLPEEGIWQNIHVHSFLHAKKLGPGSLKQAIRAIRDRANQLLEQQKFNGSIVHQPVAGLAVGPLLKHRNIPSCYFFHSPWQQEYILAQGKRNLLITAGAKTRWKLESRSLAFFDRIAVFSRSMADWIQREHPGVPTPFQVTPGVDLDRFKPSPNRVRTRQELNWPMTDILLLCIRRLVPRTGINLLIEAFAGIVSDNPRIRLLIGGEGPLRSSLEQQASELGVDDQIQFLGYIPDESLPIILNATDILVMPTVALEGLGLVTLEAMASATPVVATPVGGNIELIQPFNSNLLASEISSSALEQVLREIIAKGIDQIRQLGLEARSHVEARYGWDRTAADLKHVLEVD